jgi:hypothetical protein
MKQINAIRILLIFLIATNLFSQSSETLQARVPDFVIDSAAPTPAKELRRDAEGLNNNTQCHGHYIYLERLTTLGDFMGPTKIVRVTNYDPVIISPAAAALPQILKKVWNGQFRSASCAIDWAELVSWSIGAVVEFEDGTRGRLITDGHHVALQDRAGKNWFIRLSE